MRRTPRMFLTIGEALVGRMPAALMLAVLTGLSGLPRGHAS